MLQALIDKINSAEDLAYSVDIKEIQPVAFKDIQVLLNAVKGKARVKALILRGAELCNENSSLGKVTLRTSSHNRHQRMRNGVDNELVDVLLHKSCDVRKLDLSFCKIFPEQLKDIFKALSSNRSLRILDLSYLSLLPNAQVFEAFKDFMASQTDITRQYGLEELNLNKTLLRDEHVESITKILKGNTHLKVLRLTGNEKVTHNSCSDLLDLANNNSNLIQIDLDLALQRQNSNLLDLLKERKNNHINAVNACKKRLSSFEGRYAEAIDAIKQRNLLWLDQLIKPSPNRELLIRQEIEELKMRMYSKEEEKCLANFKKGLCELLLSDDCFEKRNTADVIVEKENLQHTERGKYSFTIRNIEKQEKKTKLKEFSKRMTQVSEIIWSETNLKRLKNRYNSYLNSSVTLSKNVLELNEKIKERTQKVESLKEMWQAAEKTDQVSRVLNLEKSSGLIPKKHHVYLSEIESFLHDSAAPINTLVDKNTGDTLLHYVIKNGYDEAVPLLLRKGASFLVHNREGKDVFSVAKEKGLGSFKTLVFSVADKSFVELYGATDYNQDEITQLKRYKSILDGYSKRFVERSDSSWWSYLFLFSFFWVQKSRQGELHQYLDILEESCTEKNFEALPKKIEKCIENAVPGMFGQKGKLHHDMAEMVSRIQQVVNSNERTRQVAQETQNEMDDILSHEIQQGEGLEERDADAEEENNIHKNDKEHFEAAAP